MMQTDIGKIEKTKNKNMTIFTKGEWKEIKGQLNFNVFEIKEKFYDFTNLQRYTYRKLNQRMKKFMLSKL